MASTFTHPLTDADEAAVRGATGEEPASWLRSQVAALLRGCADQAKARRLSACGLQATGLTDAECEALCAPREAAMAEAERLKAEESAKAASPTPEPDPDTTPAP